jgi:uncharacterized damage-inducible protein DinB
MEQLSILRDGVNHNYWARDRQLQACASLTAEQFVRPVGSSFPSVRDTLAHMLAAEWLWLERWRGKSPKSLLPAGDFPDLESVVRRWKAVELEMREYTSGLNEEALACPLTYMNFRGEEWTYSLWEMMVHMMNHQSYHRGQVATQLRILGIEPPQIDFLLWLDMGFRT